MKPRKILWKSAPWLALTLLSIVVIVLRLQLSFDLSTFFPQETNLQHDILLEQLQSGPGSRLIVIGINGSQHEQVAEFSDQMRQELASNSAFVNVLNGEFADQAGIIPEPVSSYYLLLGDIDYDSTSLQQALQLRLQDLAFGGGSELLNLVARDPFLITLDILQRLVPVNMSGDMWFAMDGSAVLMAETRAAALDLTVQADAIAAVKTTFANIPGSDVLDLEITGVGAFGLELQNTIRAETKKRSILATSALLLVLLTVYRSPRLLMLATLPIGLGFLVGLALVSLIFDNVHGITLAFGFTLLGIAIDYPIHLFSHAQGNRTSEAMARIWPTMRLGAASTAVAYLAIALSGSKGLAQLGIFTASGIIIAVLVTRTWLPALMTERSSPNPRDHSDLQRPNLIYLPVLLTLGLVLLTMYVFSEGELWDDSLSSMSPVPESRIQTDITLRSAAATPDLRYQLVQHASTLEELLRESESVDVLLQDARNDELLEAWQSISQLLPSQQHQQLRQDAIPEKGILSTRLNEALSDTPFRESAFAPFEAHASASKALPPLLPSHFEDTPLASWVDSHLIQLGDQWVSLISLNQPKPVELAERVSTWDMKVKFVDLQKSSVDLMRDYRNGAIRTIAIASLFIIVLLLAQRKKVLRILWIVLTVMAALAVTIALVTTLHNSLTVIHLVALLLVLGLGLDYALFFSRSETTIERKATNQAVLACAVSTTLAFGVLAGSPIPILKFLGLTVACGSAASFILAFVGSRLIFRKPQRVEA
jgi:predicted exporter